MTSTEGAPMTIYDYTVRTADGATRNLADYAGKVALVVNVASKCGFTPQYEGLGALQRENLDRGLVILGFPCNQFGDQEPGTDSQIQEFCATEYDVPFEVFAKVEVNGPGADPLYQYLRAQAPGDFGPEQGRMYDHIKATRPDAIGTDEVKWNFTKFLVDRQGEVIRRYESTASPEEIGSEIDAVLAHTA
jgi:glutathione peroxidase